MTPFVRFAATACGVSWAIWTPALARRGAGPVGAVSAIAGTAGPAIAADIASRRQGAGAASALARRCRRRPDAPGWWAVALGAPMATTLGAASVVARRLDPAPGRSAWTPGRLAATAAVAASAALPGGPLGEEPGWRGYALPLLQRRRSPLTASLAVGLVWSIWHVPLLAAVPDQRLGVPLRTYLVPFTVSLIGQSVFHTWLQNASGGSVPLAVLAHSAANASVLVAVADGLPELLEPDHAARSVRVLAGAWSLVALALVAATRGRLGRRP